MKVGDSHTSIAGNIAGAVKAMAASAPPAKTTQNGRSISPSSPNGAVRTFFPERRLAQAREKLGSALGTYRNYMKSIRQDLASRVEGLQAKYSRPMAAGETGGAGGVSGAIGGVSGALGGQPVSGGGSTPRAAVVFTPGRSVPTEYRNDFNQLANVLGNNPNVTPDILKNSFGAGKITAAGGGQGNVMFIKDTPFVIKKDLAGPEKRTYEFLGALDNYMTALDNCGDDRQSMDAVPVPREVRSQFSDEKLNRLKDNPGLRQNIREACPMPYGIARDANGKATVVMHNATYRDGAKIADQPVDIKIGHRISSRRELEAHEPRKASGFSWFMKKLTTRYYASMKNIDTRGYEFVAQSKDNTVRFAAALTSRSSVQNEVRKLDAGQMRDLVVQLENIQDVQRFMPVTFVGSSVMVAFPKNAGDMPGVVMGDFAHAMFHSETTSAFPPDKGAPIRQSIPESTIKKYAENYDSGIQNLMDDIRGMETL